MRRAARWGALVVLVLAALPPVWAGSSLLEGCRWLRDGRPDLAEREFTAALAQDGECAQAWVGRGVAALLEGDAVRAMERFQAARALDPSLASVCLGVGASALLAGDTSGALAEYRRAVALPVADLSAVRAAIAHCYCAMGMYAAAEQEAQTALLDRPSSPAEPASALARYVFAAALLAQRQPSRGLQAALAGSDADTLAEGIAVPSCLLAPGTRYWSEKRLGDAEPIVPQPPESLAPRSLVVIDRPKGGIVRGKTEVCVSVAGTGVAYVAVLLSGQFCAMSNVRPFAASVDTRRVSDGIHELRADAYADDGTPMGSATVSIRVDNGERTLSPAARAERDGAEHYLQTRLTLTPHPGSLAHLRARLLEASGAIQEAVAAYEYAFSYAAALPLLSADLRRAYRQAAGLIVPAAERDIHRLPPSGAGRPRIALTFDDGPHPQITPWILSLLDRYGARATFFLVGKQVDQYPELAAEIVRRGHEVACHSYTHRNLKGFTQLEVEREIVRTRAAIWRACGVRPTLFRPPGGNYDQNVRNAAQQWGFTTAFWTRNISDYTTTDPRRITTAITRDLTDGGIVLLHNGEDITREVLPLLLAELRGRGVSMVSLSAAQGDRP